MKIKSEIIPTMSIEEFADMHNLTMVVKERRKPTVDDMRFYAFFEHCEVKDDFILVSMVGNGATQEAAINDYSNRISKCLLVFSAYKQNRKEIEIPRLTGMAASDRARA